MKYKSMKIHIIPEILIQVDTCIAMMCKTWVHCIGHFEQSSFFYGYYGKSDSYEPDSRKFTSFLNIWKKFTIFVAFISYIIFLSKSRNGWIQKSMYFSKFFEIIHNLYVFLTNNPQSEIWRYFLKFDCFF